MTMKTKHPFFPILGTLLVLFLALSAAFPAQGQSRKDIAKKDLLKQGNRMYKRAEYDRADSLYAQAVALDTTYATGWYNLGNSLYLGGDAAQAQAAWMKSLFNTPQDDQRAPVLYNLGGVEMDKKNYAEAIKLYKDALRRDPSDEQARYNLALAQQLLKDQQQNQSQNNQNQNNNNNNNQNDPNQNNNNNNDNNQNNQNQNNNNNNNQNDPNQNNNNNNPNQNDPNQNNNNNNNDNNQNDPNQNNNNNNPNQNNNNNNNQNDQNQNNNNNNNQNDQNQNNNNNDNNQNNNNNNNQNDQNQNNNNNNNQNDQNQNNQNQNNNNNNPNQNNQNQNNQGGGGSSGQQAPQRLSPSDEQMLRAIDRQEQNTQDKLKGDKTEGAVIHTTKDW